MMAATSKKAKSASPVKKHTASKTTESPARKSTRTPKSPARFAPGGDPNVPAAIEEMVHAVANEAVKLASLPMTPDAITALKSALIPAFAAFVDAAHANASTRGADEVMDEDFEAVLKFYTERKKAAAEAEKK